MKGSAVSTLSMKTKARGGHCGAKQCALAHGAALFALGAKSLGVNEHPPTRGCPPPTQTPTPSPQMPMSLVFGKILGGLKIGGEAMLRVAGSTCLVFCGASFRIVCVWLIAALEEAIFLAMVVLESIDETVFLGRPSERLAIFSAIIAF